MYMKHQRTLHQKRVSKGNAKAKVKSPPVVDDAASNLSMESHVSRIRRNLSIHITRFSASESLRVYTNIYKNSPPFASR